MVNKMKKGDSQGKCRSCGEKLPPYPGRGPVRTFCAKARCNKNGRFKVINIKHSIARSGWSSTGGEAFKNVVGSDDNWYCQGCGDEIPGDLQAFRFRMRGELFKVCGICYFKIRRSGIKNFVRLLNILRNL